MNIAQLVVRAGRSYASQPALFQGDRLLCNYGKLATCVARLAGGLRARGLTAGERVALIMKNCPQYVELLFACWHAGLVVVPVNAKLHPKEFRYVLEHSGARGCFVTTELAEAVEGISGELPDVAWVEDVSGEAYRRLTEAEPAEAAAVNPTDTAWLFYTSGTTGRPKGAMLSHRNLLTMSMSYFIDVDSIAPSDCIVHAAPMSHGSGLYVLPHVAAAAAHVLPDSGGFEPEEILALIRNHSGVSFFAAPTMVTRLMAHPQVASADMTNLKTIIYGGGPMYLEDCKRAIAVFGNRLAQIYGQGESPMTITALGKHHFANSRHPRYNGRLGSVGVPHTAVEVVVVDQDGRSLPAGVTGEVLVRGDSVMSGYWRDPEASAETLKGGWLHSGDMASFDEDGFLTLKDRSKDVIISGGTNIYPREVEEVLLTDPRLFEVAVIGRKHADWGEEVVAFVVTKPGRQIERAELDALCLEHIARFKRPKDYYFIDALPKNNYGKVLKIELRRMLADNEVAS
ncbi:MAG: AMP-binding protein [Aquisalimonadaceae bacterium]